MSGSGIEDGGSLEWFIASGGGESRCFGQKNLNIGGGEFVKGAGSFKSLIENLHAVDAGDDDGSWKVQSVLQAFEGGDALAFENVAAGDRLHARYADLFWNEDGQHLLFEATEVRVHDVEGHLHGVEREMILIGKLEHSEMDAGIFVTGESGVANLAGLLGGVNGFDSAAFGEEAVGILETNIFVKLPEVDVICLQALKRFIELLDGRGFGAAVVLGHDEDFVTAPL